MLWHCFFLHYDGINEGKEAEGSNRPKAEEDSQNVELESYPYPKS